uniref:hypothetical protein n=1 Tax=Xanthobacter cornucopiae TaxID=3119924 RepID=UPI00372D5026
MTAFNWDVLLLLSAAFLLGLALGLWLRGSRRGAAPGSIPVAGAGGRASPAEATAAVAPGQAGDPGEGMSIRSEPVPSPAGPPALPPLREPVADVFGHLLKVPPGAIVEAEDQEPEPSRRTEDRGAHPGVPPPVLAAPDGGVADDLKLLKGIGPQNEQRLQRLGIFHFRQIAAWTPDEAAWVGSYLAFPGRIEREDWIGQAKALAAGDRPDPRAPRRPRAPG